MENLNEFENYISPKDLIKVFILAIVLAFSITRFILPVKIKGKSMEPSIHDGSYVLINRINKNLVAGDIVSFHIYDKEYLVKRVIALEGDDLEINNGQVYVNGVRLEESYVKEPWYDGIYSGIIPDGHIFVMGDNRNDSIDSRNIGAVKKSKVLGKMY